MAFSLMVMSIVLLAFQSNSHALTIGFNDFIDPIFYVTDGSSDDSNSLTGAVTFNGTIGTWTVNVTTGLSKPILGSATSPEMDLNSINVTSTSGGHLRFGVVDSGFTGPTAGTYSFLVGGTTQGSVFFDVFTDATNSETFIGTIFASDGPFSGGAFSDTKSGSFNVVTTPFSLGIIADITQTGTGSTSFNAELQVVPLPPYLILLGSGLLGLVGLRRFRKS